MTHPHESSTRRIQQSPVDNSFTRACNLCVMIRPHKIQHTWHDSFIWEHATSAAIACERLIHMCVTTHPRIFHNIHVIWLICMTYEHESAHEHTQSVRQSPANGLFTCATWHTRFVSIYVTWRDHYGCSTRRVRQSPLESHLSSHHLPNPSSFAYRCLSYVCRFDAFLQIHLECIHVSSLHIWDVFVSPYLYAQCIQVSRMGWLQLVGSIKV